VALDIGEVRCGIAATDASGRVVMPVKVLPMDEVLSGARSWKRILEDHEPELIVSGLPASLSGGESAQTERVRSIAEKVSADSGIPLEFFDERLTSAEARRILHEQGLSERAMRGKVDMVAASLLLEAWLAAQSRENTD
ncbi:MAG: Holliday junction resolvase RuvX, partial [Atopobiaceae bacterium]|nr:Holliday junction resolvase RuvX [Atopobiaceae bacterium]